MRYAGALPAYLAAGWPAVLPMPLREKWPPPKGWTGRDAPWPDPAQHADWRVERPHANVALRMPTTVLGIDLDAYRGGDLEELAEECGELPRSWVSTSRDDGSGIRLYRVPAGVRWREARAGTGIDLLTASHRYAVVWPSVHPEGRMYRWYAPDGRVADRVPRVDELPALPAAWGRRLSEPPTPSPVRTYTHPALMRTTPIRSAYAAGSLAGAVAELAAMRAGDGRNNAANRKAFSLAGFVAAGELDERTVREQLLAAMVANGYVAKRGERRTLATIDSGLRAGMARPRAGV